MIRKNKGGEMPPKETPTNPNIMDEYTVEKCQGASWSNCEESYYACLQSEEICEQSSVAGFTYTTSEPCKGPGVRLQYILFGDFVTIKLDVREKDFCHAEFRARKKALRAPFKELFVDHGFMGWYPENIGTGKATTVRWWHTMFEGMPVFWSHRAKAQSGGGTSTLYCARAERQSAGMRKCRDGKIDCKLRSPRFSDLTTKANNKKTTDSELMSTEPCARDAFHQSAGGQKNFIKVVRNCRKTKQQSLKEKVAKANFDAIKKVEMAQERKFRKALKNVTLSLRRARLAKTEEYIITPQMGLGVPVHHGLNNDAKEFLNVFKTDILNTLSGMHGTTITAVQDARRVVEESVKNNPINDALTSMTMAIWIIPVVCLVYYVSTRSDLSMHVKGMITFLSLLLPVAFSPLLGLLQKKIEVVEPQAGGLDFDFLKKLIAMGTLIVGLSKFNGDICDFVLHVLEKGPQRMMSANTYTGFMAWVITGIEDVINAIRHVFGKESIAILRTGQRDVDDWADRLEFVLQGIITDKIKVDIDLVHTLTALRCEATDLMKLYRFKKDISGMLEKYLRRLDDVCSKNASVFSAAKNTRVEPVCLALVGKPGIGKTLLCTAVAAEVIARLAPEEKLRDPNFNIGADIFQKGSSKYDNGYVGQCVYVMDDAFQQVYAEGDQDNDFMRLIRVVNSWMLPLDFADVENKGKNFFRSKFVMITTNVHKLTTIAQNCVNDPSAVVRRIHHPYQLGVTDAFRLPGKTKWEEKSLDTAKVTAFQKKHGRFPFEAWTIKHHNFSSGVSAGNVEYSFDKLIPDIVAEIKRNKERHDDTHKMCEGIVKRRLDELERQKRGAPCEPEKPEEEPCKKQTVDETAKVKSRKIEVVEVSDDDSDDVPELEEDTDDDETAGVVPQAGPSCSEEPSPQGTEKPWWDDCLETEFKRRWLKAREEHNILVRKWFKQTTKDDLGVILPKRAFNLQSLAEWSAIPQMEYVRLVGVTHQLEIDFCKFIKMYNKKKRELFPEGGYNTAGYWTGVERIQVDTGGFLFRAARRIFDFAVKPGWLYANDLQENGHKTDEEVVVDEGFKKHVKTMAKGLLNTLIALKVILCSALICLVEVMESSPALRFILAFAFGFLVTSIVKNVLSSMSTFFFKSDVIENQAVNFKTLVNLAAPVESKMDVHKSVVKNLYRAVVIRDGGYFHLGNVTGISGKIFCIPTHFFETVRIEKEKKIMKAGDKIVFINTSNRNLEFDIELDSFCSLKRKDFEDTDCSFVEFPVSLSAHDISSKFLTEKEVSSFTTFQCAFATSTQDRNNVERVWFHEQAIKMNSTLGVGESDLKYNVKRTFKYKIPTVGGDCGGILFLGPNVRQQSNGARIVGFHTGANMSLGLGFSTVVTREMVLEAISFFKATVEEEVTDQNIVAQSDNQFVEGSVLPLYELEVGTKAAPYSKLTKTFLYEGWGKNTKYPTPLGHHIIDGEIVKPMINAVKKYTGKVMLYDQKELKCAAYTAFLPLTECSKNVMREERVVLSFEEAIIGDPNDPMMNSIPRNTSAGYPRSLEKGVNGKKDFFGFDDEYDLTSDNAKVLKQDVEDIILKAEKNIRKLHIFTDFLKDERRPSGKGARLVSGAPIAYVVAFRMYFLKFISTMMRERITNGCCAGINVYQEWQYLWNHLTSVSLTGVAGDYSAFDSSEQPQFHNEILDYINAWYDDGETCATVRKVLWLELTHSRHLGGDGKENKTVYQWFHSLPSGHPATTITNSMYNLMLFVMCYQRLLGTNALVDYHKLVRPVVLGDDNVVAIHPSIQDKFNQDSITVEMKKLGMTYTSEDKDTLVAPIRELKTVGFLKRGFRSEIIEGVEVILGPLSLDTIREMPYWCRNKGEMEQICCDNFETALIELSAHPASVWEEIGSKMLNTYKAQGRNTAIAPERNLYLRRFLSMEKAF